MTLSAHAKITSHFGGECITPDIVAEAGNISIFLCFRASLLMSFCIIFHSFLVTNTEKSSNPLDHKRIRAYALIMKDALITQRAIQQDSNAKWLEFARDDLISQIRIHVFCAYRSKLSISWQTDLFQDATFPGFLKK